MKNQQSKKANSKLKTKNYKLFLIGFMGCGKTTFGKKLANKLKLEFIDMDDIIENTYGKSIAMIFENEGEGAFRKKESHILNKIILKNNFVVATGGGTPCFYDNIEIMKKAGMVIYLKMSPKSLADRLYKQKDKRPIIKDCDNKDLVNFITEKLKKREEYYEQADLIVKGESIKTDEVIKMIKKII
ncbi:MAG: shikimate kinase [Bacteroidales bacterium]|nr:shikimate kinase [Bacteroidales bacterium]